MEHKKTLHCMAEEGHVRKGHGMGHLQVSPCSPHWMSLKGYPILFRTRPPVKSGRSQERSGVFGGEIGLIPSVSQGMLWWIAWPTQMISVHV